MDAISRALDKFTVGDGCWEWTGCRAHGYGRFAPNGSRSTINAHRFIWELLHGPIEPGKHLDHLCRNRACVNPSHLEPVPQKVNVLRGVGKTAINSKKAKCPRGHFFEAERDSRGQRTCKLCVNARSRRMYRENPLAFILYEQIRYQARKDGLWK